MAKRVTVIPAKQVRVRSAKCERSEKIRVAAYCRVSTDQEEQLNSFENQVEYYTRYINSLTETFFESFLSATYPTGSISVTVYS